MSTEDKDTEGLSHGLEMWLKTPEYLPPFLRDFHDQKDFFKALNEVVERREYDPYTKGLGWRMAHVFTIDIFLWVMARHGYTLQKTRKKLPFPPIEPWKQSELKERNSSSPLKQHTRNPGDGQ